MKEVADVFFSRPVPAYLSPFSLLHVARLFFPSPQAKEKGAFSWRRV